jgi:hypothetical protein
MRSRIDLDAGGTSMRQFTVGLLAGSILLSTACSKNPGENASSTEGARSAAAQDYFTVRAGPVANAKINALAGTFQMLKVGQGNGIPSDGKGGACLAFRAADLGFTEMAKAVCHSNSDCSHEAPPGTTGDEAFSYAPDPGNPAHRENRYGYCDQSSNQCWSKPIVNGGNEKVCNRPITMTPTTLNPVPKDPIDVTQLNVSSKGQVRVVACINKGTAPYPGGRPPCSKVVSPDRIEVMGPSANVHS